MTKTVASDEVEWPDILEEVKNTHETVVITEEGKPVARLSPLRGPMDRRIQFLGDITGK